MDVRCEKCGTEYEFDEGKLKPGGVTVKCAECGHMFRVRKRSPTGVGVSPASPSSPPPVPAKITASPSSPAGGLAAASGASGRVWLIRDEEGKVQTCRELATLQQWVVAGRVTRECEISRTGKSWKKLGTIAELGSFFRIAEEARRATSGALPTQQPPAGNGQAAAPAAPIAPAAAENTAPLPGAVQPPAKKRESGPPPSTRPRTSRPIPSAAGTPSPDDAPGPGPGPMAQSVGERPTGGWAAQPSLRLDSEGGGPAGPTGGLAKGVPTNEAAFASGGGRKPLRADDIMPKQFEPTDAFLDDDITDFGSPSGGAGKWIVLVSLLLLAGAGAAVYLFVFKARDDVDKQGALAQGAADAAGIAPPTPTPTPTPTPAVDPEEVLTASYADLAADTDTALEAAAARLEALQVDDPAVTARVTAARARVLAAQAQHALDAGGDDAASESKKIAGEAAQLSADALAAKADSADAKVAMADALRLKGSRTADVERHLKDVLQGDPRHREALLVRAMLRERDGKDTDARSLYTDLAKDGRDVRPIYRLARMDFADKKYDVAQTRAARVLGMQADHGGAQALKEAIGEATAVVQTDPMPPEVGKGGDSKHSGGGNGGGGSYDSILAKADKLAENGKCSKAMDVYRKALDANPGGVGALVGMGYCHIDARQFASAHAKFRAALGISSRHHGALIGIAEAYRYQGLNKQALEAYRKYLEIHPGGPKATMARKQIERLGGGDDQEDKPDDKPDDQPFDDQPPAPDKEDTEELGERVDPGSGD